MSFVKDDHGYTRGPGAIAAMDAVSSARRLAAARAERALRVREALTQGAIETGQEAAFSRPPPAPTRGAIKLPFRPKGLELGVRPFVRPAVKLPGSVITPPSKGTDTDTAPAKTPSAPSPAPSKSPSIVSAGGSGTSWTAGTKGAAAPRAELPQFSAEVVETPEMQVAVAPAAPAAPKKKSNMLLYAAIGAGIGALWLITRRK